MSIFLALVLGVVQGLTEFLPVSSSGHLILCEHLFGLETPLLFNIVLHVATLCAVVVVFWKRILGLICRPFEAENRRLIICLVLTTAVTCGLVVLFKDLIERTFTAAILPFSFLVTAVLLFFTSFVRPSAGGVRVPRALLVGFTQGLAVVPGLSRSGTTISTLLCSGVDRQVAAEYSFLMSIPVIFASFVFELMSSGAEAHMAFWPTAAAFLAALGSGIFAIRFMLRVIARVRLHWFSFYLVGLSLFCFFIL